MKRRAAAVVGIVAAMELSPSPLRAQCVETAPATGAGLELRDTFPQRGTSGYAAALHVVVSHGQGETVLPRGIELQRDSDTARALRSAGFELPDEGAPVSISSGAADPKTGRRDTTIDLPVLVLPDGPGRHALTLPALPIAVARASGDLITLCTQSHRMIVDDPIASTPDPQPRGNPAPRAQREEWIALKHALAWATLGTIAGSVLAWLVHRWMKRPRPVAPPPPPRLPWEVAIERLDEARHAGLLETARFGEFFDRVNDAVREYLGARFGFDGLESTTDETLAALRRIPSFVFPMPEIAGFLQHCDLVKFADLTPSLDECERALAEAERIVRSTIPRPRETPPAVERRPEGPS
jgi:hypothetical protein